VYVYLVLQKKDTHVSRDVGSNRGSGMCFPYPSLYHIYAGIKHCRTRTGTDIIYQAGYSL